MSDSQLIRCPSCGATNRVSQEAREKIGRGLAPVCGRCKTPLSADAKPVTVTDATFASEVERSPLPVVLDVWAAWCGPCRMLAPVIDELASEFVGRVRFAKLNSDGIPRHRPASTSAASRPSWCSRGVARSASSACSPRSRSSDGSSG